MFREPPWWVRDIIVAGLIGGILAVSTVLVQQHIDDDRSTRELVAAGQLAAQSLRLENLRFVRDRSGTSAVDRPFRGLDLEGQELSGLELSGADFAGADLKNATFNGSNLTGADFTGANLRGAKFTNVNVSGAIFSHLHAEGAQFFSNVGTGPTTELRLDQVNITAGYLAGMRLSVFDSILDQSYFENSSVTSEDSPASTSVDGVCFVGTKFAGFGTIASTKNYAGEPVPTGED